MSLLYVIKWDEVIQSVVINIICGLIVSFIFLYTLLQFLRPSFEISKKICCTTDPETGKKSYKFKVVNKSIYHAFDTKFELFLMEPVINTVGSYNLKYRVLETNPCYLNHCPRVRNKPSIKDPSALFATILRTEEPIEDMLNKTNTYVELKITARHGLTGLAGAFTQQFGGSDVIAKDHKFQFGKKIGTMHVNDAVEKK